MPLRPPVHADDRWYPSRRAELIRRLTEFVPERDDACEAVAVVAPHAGYDYSGAVAGAAYARVVVPGDVVLLSLHHRPSSGPAFALFDEGVWQTPLGDVPIATQLVAAIAAECPMVEADCRVHFDEHSGELHVPFLQFRNPHVRIAPICITHATAASACELGESLARAVERLGRPALLVASTDLSHEQPQRAPSGAGILSGENLRDYVCRQDDKVLDRILALDAKGLWETREREGVTMCGFAPVTAALAYAKARGATRAELVEHTTSADVSGSYHYIVGYAGVIIR